LAILRTLSCQRSIWRDCGYGFAFTGEAGRAGFAYANPKGARWPSARQTGLPIALVDANPLKSIAVLANEA